MKGAKYCMKASVKVYDHFSKHPSPRIFLFGNGGSAAIANHIEADWTKCSNGAWNVQSLCANPSMLTMIGNDYGYDYAASMQLLWKGHRGDHVILISSSGNSPSIVRAADFASHAGISVIGLTGFDGGYLKQHSDLSIHLDTTDYEEAENYHQRVLHSVSRLLRGSQ